MNAFNARQVPACQALQPQFRQSWRVLSALLSPALCPLSQLRPRIWAPPPFLGAWRVVALPPTRLSAPHVLFRQVSACASPPVACHSPGCRPWRPPAHSLLTPFHLPNGCERLHHLPLGRSGIWMLLSPCQSPSALPPVGNQHSRPVPSWLKRLGGARLLPKCSARPP